MKSLVLTLTLLCTAVFFGSACSDDDDDSGRIYQVGEFYNSGGVKGVVFEIEDGGRHGMIVSLDQTTAQWATEAAASVRTGAQDEDDGEDNMEIIQRIPDWQTKFPAFAWCGAMNSGSVRGWFLPAFEELKVLYVAYAANEAAFNKVLTDNGGTALVLTSAEEGRYWASSENLVAGKENEAANYDFTSQVFGFSNKTLVARVRAVREF